MIKAATIKKLVLSVVLMISMATTMNAQQYLGKVSAEELANIGYLIKYYNKLPMSTVISDLPEAKMIQIMTAIDKQCESAYILNKIYATDPNSKILKQAVGENMVVVPGGRLIDYTKALMRFNNLKY